jgi:hypothetical protein
MPEVSDTPQSPFAVALQLTRIIALGEGKSLREVGMTPDGVTKDYVLGLYRECLDAVASQGTLFTHRG